MVKINNLIKKFGNQSVINQLNVELYKDEITVITGVSGVGKSTLLNIIGNLEKPDEGEILFKESEFSESIGYIFQDKNLFNGLTVKENIIFALSLENINISDEDLELALNIFNIQEVGFKKIELLSSGERQRVAICRTYLLNKKIILADEPTGNLDRENSENIFKLFQKIKKDKVIIVVTHDIDLAHKYGDRVLKLENGTIIDEKKNNDTNYKYDDYNINKKYKKYNFFSKLINFWSKRFRKKIKKMSLLVTSLTISLALILTVFNIFGNLQQMSNVNNINYFESDLIILRKQSEEKYLSNFVYQDDLNEINGEYDISQSYLVYETNLYFSFNNNYVELNDRQIVYNDFFKYRLSSLEIEGEFPSEKNEVILSENNAIILFGDANCIGNTIDFTDGRGNNITVIISAVNYQITALGENLDYISVDLVKELMEMSEFEQEYVEVRNIKEYDNLFVTSGVYATFDNISSLPNPNDYLSLNVTDVVITERLLYDISETNNISYLDFKLLNKTDKNIYLNNIVNEQYVIENIDNYIVNITNFIEGDEPQIYFNDSIINDMKNIHTKVALVYFENPYDIDDFFSKYEENPYDITIYSVNIRYTILHDTLVYQISFLVLSIILFLSTLMQIRTFTNINIIEAEQDIGLLKTLGAKNSLIKSIFIADILMVVITSTVFAMILQFIIVILLPLIIPQLQILNYSINIGILLIILFFSSIISILSIFSYLRQISKKSITNLLKQ